MNPELTPELLASIAGILLSLVFSYIPGLNVKFAALENIHKRLVMLALTFVAAGGIFALSCAGLNDYVTCKQTGAWGLLQLFIRAAIANQSAYLLSTDAPAVRAVKLEQAINGQPHGQG